MAKISARERSFLLMQNAWALAMSGACANWREIEARLADSDPQPFRIEGRALQLKFDEVCVRTRAALGAGAPARHTRSTEELIWSIIDAERVAYWMRDVDTFARLHLDDPRFRLMSWVHSGGMTERRGYDAFIDAWRKDVANFPAPNPYCAYLSERRKETLTVSGDMAWASFHTVYPIADLPGFNGLGVAQEVRILERRRGEWRISFCCTIDDQFGQNSAPIWEVDASGQILSANPAASGMSTVRDGIGARAGRLRAKGAENDRRLGEAIQSAANVGHGIYSRYRARSTILEQDDGAASQAVWVVNQGSKLRVSLNSLQTFGERLETATSAYGLSPAQCRLAARIVEGTSLAEAARREGVSASTARTQLQRIFEKVGVRTQSGLVSALIAAVERAPLD